LDDTVGGKVYGAGHGKDKRSGSGNVWGTDADAAKFSW
jgi:hypothetical protein